MSRNPQLNRLYQTVLNFTSESITKPATISYSDLNTTYHIHDFNAKILAFSPTVCN